MSLPEESSFGVYKGMSPLNGCLREGAYLGVVEVIERFQGLMSLDTPSEGTGGGGSEKSGWLRAGAPLL